MLERQNSLTHLQCISRLVERRGEEGKDTTRTVWREHWRPRALPVHLKHLQSLRRRRTTPVEGRGLSRRKNHALVRRLLPHLQHRVRLVDQHEGGGDGHDQRPGEGARSAGNGNAVAIRAVRRTFLHLTQGGQSDGVEREWLRPATLSLQRQLHARRVRFGLHAEQNRAGQRGVRRGREVEGSGYGLVMVLGGLGVAYARR